MAARLLEEATQAVYDLKWFDAQTTESYKALVCETPLRELPNWLNLVYLYSAMCFILALRSFNKVATAPQGNVYGILGMALAIGGPWVSSFVCGDGLWLIAVGLIPGGLIGVYLAQTVTMIGMPQLVGLLNAFGGLASSLEAIGLYLSKDAQYGPNGERQGFLATAAGHELMNESEDEMEREVNLQTLALFMSLIVGSVTFFGSLVACAKLQGTLSSAARVPPARTAVTIGLIGAIIVCCVLAETQGGYGSLSGLPFVILAFVLSGLWGIMFTIAIGGADMPVVICVLNTGSGFAGVFAGFMLANKLLVITGAFVGASGAILSVIMCEAMNRSLWNVLVGGFGDTGGGGQAAAVVEGEKKEINTDDMAKKISEAKNVILVPGYGMAAGKAQHAVAKFTEICRDRGVRVRFAIHPVAGRLPGHMNVLLAEARVPYDIVLSMDEINMDFKDTDVVMVIGANDIVNPAAAEDPTSPIAGMPVLEVWNAGTTVVIKRGGGTGYSGAENPLFVRDNNYMYYGNAKAKMEELGNKLAEIPADKWAAHGSGGGAKTSSNDALLPPPEPKKDYSGLPSSTLLGVLKEASDARVAITPDIGGRLREAGYGVLVEEGAGVKAGFPDSLYIEHGCTILPRLQVCHEAQLVFAVSVPSDADLHNLGGKYLVAWVGRLTPDGKQIMQRCQDAKVNLMDVTAVPRISTAQKLDCLSSQAKVAGHRSVVEALHEFGKFFAPEITAAGKYPPANVMVLGCGVAGLAAIGTAVSLGAQVRAWDVRDVSDQVVSMGGSWFSVDFKEEGAGAGGYAKESSAAFAEAQKKTFHEHAKRCDIVITTAAIPGRPSPKLLEEYMIKDMKPGSVIVDLGSVGGGNCVGTVAGQKIKTENGVTLIGYTDFPARMAYQASAMFAGNMANLVDHIQGKGKAEDFFSGLRGLLSDKDAVVDAVLCVQDGESRTMPPPPQPSPISPKKEKAPAAKAEIKKVSVGGGGPLSSTAAMMFYFAVVLAGCSASAPNVLVELLVVFTLACVVGYMLVWGVEPALHTPLMSVSNAISGQVVLGGLFMVSTTEAAMKWFGVGAIFIAAINVFGGFTVTRRMLAMYQTSDNDKKAEATVPRTIGAAPTSPKGQTYAKLTPGAE